jgi:CBS domain-containing protein
MHVENIMTRDPVTCDWQASIGDVAKLMSDKAVGCVVVLRDGKVWGMVTDRQVACDGVGQGLPVEQPVDAICTHNPATLTLEDTVFSAIDTLRSAGMVRRVPVVNRNNELLGLVSLSDIAVVAKDLMDAIMLDEVHHATKEARVLTGGKMVQKEIRRPTTELPRGMDVRPTTQPSMGMQADVSRGTRGAAPGMRAEGVTGEEDREAGRRGEERDERREGWKRSWWPFG